MVQALLEPASFQSRLLDDRVFKAAALYRAFALQSFWARKHLRGDAGQRQNLVRRAHLYRGAGHAEYHATFFVLRDGVRSRLSHSQESARAVVAHACQNDSHRISS